MKLHSISSQINQNTNPQKVKQNVSFGSITHAVDNLVSKRSILSKFFNNIEFDGCSMSSMTLYSVIMGGVVLPRLLRAREDNERKEIIFRDTISIATVVFAFKIIERLFSKISSVKSGFALAIKPKNHETLGQKFANYIKPVTGVHVLTGADIVSKYSRIQNYRDGLAGFLSFVNRQGGDIKKMFAINPNASEYLREAYNRTKYARLVSYKDAKNVDIVRSMYEAVNHKSEFVNKIYNIFEAPKNPFVMKAKNMNSLFSFLSMVVIVPALLGWTIPKMNEQRTKDREKAKFEAQYNAQHQNEVAK